MQEASPPKCYPDAMFTRMQMIYNAFAVYDNTLVRVAYGLLCLEPLICDPNATDRPLAWPMSPI